MNWTDMIFSWIVLVVGCWTMSLGVLQIMRSKFQNSQLRLVDRLDLRNQGIALLSLGVFLAAGSLVSLI